MFKITGPLLDKKALNETKFKRAVQTAVWPSFEADDVWSKEEWERLEKEFRGFTGPVRDPDNFALVVQLRKGEATWIEYASGDIIIDLFEDEEIWERQDLLKITERVEQIKAVKKAAPNSPCSCGSGKKTKKCCGR